MPTNTTPEAVRARQKAEADALRTTHTVERKVLTELAKLSAEDARAVIARAAMAFAPTDDEGGDQNESEHPDTPTTRGPR